MASVRTESETDEIALVSSVGEAGIGKIAELVGLEIKNRDGLVRLRLLRAVAVIQQRREAAVRSERDGRRKTVHRANAAGRGRIQQLAGG
jgi:hypothetical protein